MKIFGYNYLFNRTHTKPTQTKTLRSLRLIDFILSDLLRNNLLLQVI